MTANQKVVEQKYQQLNSLLPHLSEEERREYDLVLKQAFLHKLMKNARAFMGTPTEELVIKSLGYKLEDYQNRSQTIEKANQIILEKLNSASLAAQSMKEMEREVKIQIGETRLKLAGLDPAHINMVYALGWCIDL